LIRICRSATMLLMKPYSEDLRRKIVSAVERGMPKTEAARTFGVSLSSVKRYWRLAARKEPLAPRKGGGRPPKTDAATARLLEEDVARRPYASAHERAAFLRTTSGAELSASTIRRLLRKLGFSQKNGAWVRQSATSS
jgi:transposase